ncbi:MAG: 50S ribosomal protein L11 methyltransferase [Microthrixaceae bacterium]
MERLVVAVRVEPADVELVADELLVLGASAVSELPVDGSTTIDLVADLEAASLAELGRPHRVLEPDRTWFDGWRAHARSVRAGRFLLRPAWLDADATDAGATDADATDADATDDEGVTAEDPGRAELVEILLDPEDAFGSGSHATTRLCAALVGELVQPGNRVVDVGCGSGVLAIAAAFAGAAAVDALDIDPAARRATERNAARNGVDSVVSVVDATVPQLASRVATGDHPASDVVVANLLLPIVDEFGADLVRLAGGSATVVVSGLLADQVDRAVVAVGLPPVSEHAEGEWRAVVFRTDHRTVNPL